MTNKIRAAALGAALVVGALAPGDDVDAQGAAPPYLDILSAGIREQAPIDSGTVSARVVLLRVEVAEQAASLCGAAVRRYGFLVDADRQPSTGQTAAAFPGLGIDAQLFAECNGGAWSSPLGAVTVQPNASGTGSVIQIQTAAGLLPSGEFNWVAFARQGSRVTRLPASGAGYWTIAERAIP